MLSLFVAAMDATVVGTALPTIAKELGNFQLYPWVVAGYLITATTTVPIWGRLADLRGRRLVLLSGIVIFIVSSALCAASPSMGWLIGFRTLQGIGAGCIQPVVFTIVGDIFPLAQRARLQGFFSSMWAIAAIVGPALGALFVSTIGWRWIFTINVPAGLLASALIWGYRERKPQATRGSVDLRGTILLTLGVALLLVGLGTGSQTGSPIWPLLPLAIIALLVFVRLEWRNPTPTVPLRLLRHPIIGPAIAIAVVSGTLMFAVTAYVPLWVQSVQGGSAYAAGVAVGAMSIGWPILSAISGLIMVRVGYERLLLAGALALLAGSLLLALTPASMGPLWTGVASLVIGAGMGSFAAPLLIVIQSNVEWGQRGAATALNQFSRTIGGAVGVAILGVVLERFVGTARAPLQARAELEAGLHTDFLVLVILAALVLATAIAVLASSRKRKRTAQSVSATA